MFRKSAAGNSGTSSPRCVKQKTCRGLQLALTLGERWADTRIHSTTKREVAAMFAEEKPHLEPLPLEPFGYYQYGERVVHLDGCVEVEAAYYSLPPGWIGRPVKVQWDALHLRVLQVEVRLDTTKSRVVGSRPRMKDTTVSFKIERTLKFKLLALAKAENRSLSNFIEKLLKAEVAKHESKRGQIKTD